MLERKLRNTHAKCCPKWSAALLNPLRFFGCETELGKPHKATLPSRFRTLPKRLCLLWATVSSSMTPSSCIFRSFFCYTI